MNWKRVSAWLSHGAIDFPQLANRKLSSWNLLFSVSAFTEIPFLCEHNGDNNQEQRQDSQGWVFQDLNGRYQRVIRLSGDSSHLLGWWAPIKRHQHQHPPLLYLTIHASLTARHNMISFIPNGITYFRRWTLYPRNKLHLLSNSHEIIWR